jgi:hypothetical protein
VSNLKLLREVKKGRINFEEQTGEEIDAEENNSTGIKRENLRTKDERVGRGEHDDKIPA